MHGHGEQNLTGSWLVDAMKLYADTQEERDEYYKKYAETLKNYDDSTTELFELKKFLAKYVIQYSKDVKTDENKYRINVELTNDMIERIFVNEKSMLALRAQFK